MKQVVFQGKNIFYHAEGNGKAVMLLHGFAEDSTIWHFQAEKLKERFFVIVPDLPGSGTSDMLEGDKTIEDYASVVKAIIDAELNNKKDNRSRSVCTLIGHSMGGYITLAFAEKYPALLDGFGLFHSSAYADDESKKEARRKGIEIIKNNGASEFLKATIPSLFSEKTKTENPALVESFIDHAKSFSPGSLIQYYAAMIQRPDRTFLLKSFHQPILFIIGKNDMAVPLAMSLEQSYLPSISHVHILQNSAHMGMLEEKEKSTEMLLNFLTTP